MIFETANLLHTNYPDPIPCSLDQVPFLHYFFFVYFTVLKEHYHKIPTYISTV